MKYVNIVIINNQEIELEALPDIEKQKMIYQLNTNFAEYTCSGLRIICRIYYGPFLIFLYSDSHWRYRCHGSSLASSFPESHVPVVGFFCFLCTPPVYQYLHDNLPLLYP